MGSKKEIIVGVNKYPPPEEQQIPTLSIDNSTVLNSQMKRLDSIRSTRDEQKARAALDAITAAVTKPQGSAGSNLLELSINAARVRCTVGEISYAIEQVVGRYSPTNQLISGAYAKGYSDQNDINSLRERVKKFSEKFGRSPRILIAKVGQDGHDRGQKVVATGFADVGFDVDIGPLFQTPAEVAKQAIDSDVHVVGISSQAAGHMTLVPELIKELKQQGESQIQSYVEVSFLIMIMISSTNKVFVVSL